MAALMPGERNRIPSDHPKLNQSSFRAAVAAVINSIKAELSQTDHHIADKLECSATTINNASNQRGNLDAVTVLRLGEAYGISRLGPIVALLGATLEPAVESSTSTADMSVGAARGQLFLAQALVDHKIDDAEILAGAEDIEAAAETFATLKWRLDGIRARREQRG